MQGEKVQGGETAVKPGPSPAAPGHRALEAPLSDATKILEKTSSQQIEQACETRFEADTYPLIWVP